ncbi:MAG: transmembrane anchor protein [Betaproteobacteria bacterium HGW-Betaproteobacteria-15]|nr:MAG: transmembrane anchor protein [Betaproteobacteria bacterium HGW-Betaproteobacteria-15]
MYNTDLPRRAELPSSAQLLKSTAIAAVGAAVLLVAVVLPSEYGVDPTGAGRALGLTTMGEIKQELAREAAAEAQATAALTAPAPAPSTAPRPTEAPATTAVSSPTAPAAAAAEPAVRNDEVSVTLKPGEAAEYKLSMREGAKVDFEWTSVGGGVNFDAHGDPVNAPRDFYHGYGKGRNSSGETGELVAAFDGTHGWFWRNRSGQTVTVTLKVRGAYSAIKRMV